MVHEEIVLLREMERLFKASCVAQHLNSHPHIEVDACMIRIDELVELLLFLQLCVAVDEQRCVLAVRQSSHMKCLQIGRQLRHSLSIQELLNDIGRLDEANRLLVLLDGLLVLVYA